METLCVGRQQIRIVNWRWGGACPCWFPPSLPSLWTASSSNVLAVGSSALSPWGPELGPHTRLIALWQPVSCSTTGRISRTLTWAAISYIGPSSTCVSHLPLGASRGAGTRSCTFGFVGVMVPVAHCILCKWVLQSHLNVWLRHQA